jgi:hypothetical protein
VAEAYKYSSTAVETTLTGGIDGSDTTISVGSTSGFPTAPFKLTLAPDTGSEEIVKVTNVGGLSLTVVRGHDGSVAVGHSAGDVVKHQVTAEDLRLSRQHEDATADVHGVGVTADVVGTTTVQTLEGKTIDGQDNTLQNIDPTESISAYVDNQVEANETLTTGLAYVGTESHTPRPGVLSAAPDLVFPSSSVVPTPSGGLEVTLSGTNIHCSPGRAVVASFFGARIAKRGAGGDTGLDVAAPHATLDRWDIVCITLSESAFGAPGSTMTYVEGTPAGSPAEPSVPADSLILARIQVTNSGGGGGMVVRERRVRAVANGGILPVLGNTERDALDPHEGDVVWNGSSSRIEVYNGTQWVAVSTTLGSNWAAALAAALDTDAATVLGAMGTGWPATLAAVLSTLRPVDNFQAANDTTTSITYVPGTTNGTSFTAPPSGIVIVTASGGLGTSHASLGEGSWLSYHVRNGGTVGSGTDVVVGHDDRSAKMTAQSTAAGFKYVPAMVRRRVTGLASGGTYNVVSVFRNSNAAGGGTAAVIDRHIMVEPVL